MGFATGAFIRKFVVGWARRPVYPNARRHYAEATVRDPSVFRTETAPIGPNFSALYHLTRSSEKMVNGFEKSEPLGPSQPF